MICVASGVSILPSPPGQAGGTCLIIQVGEALNKQRIAETKALQSEFCDSETSNRLWPISTQ